MSKKKFYEFKNKTDNSADLYIYGEISSTEGWFSDGTETTPTNFKEDLDSLGDIDVLKLYISSPGGDVFAGQTIYSMLKRNKATINVYIDGLAASIASVVAMAGDTIKMPSNSMMMIHNPWSCMQGNSTDFRKMADDLDKIGLSIQETYMAKAKDMKQEDLMALMDAESWLTAKECLDLGLCDVVEEAKEIAARVTDFEILNKYKHLPESIAKQEPEKPISPISNKGNTKTEEIFKTIINRLDKLEKPSIAKPIPKNNKDIELLKAKLALECQL